MSPERKDGRRADEIEAKKEKGKKEIIGRQEVRREEQRREGKMTKRLIRSGIHQLQEKHTYIQKKKTMNPAHRNFVQNRRGAKLGDANIKTKVASEKQSKENET